MTLNVDTSQVADLDAAKETTDLRGIGVLLMTIGVRSITDANLHDTFLRVSFMEKVTGTYRYVSEGEPGEERWADKPWTKDELSKWVGVTTNVSDLSITKFKTHVWDLHKRYTR